MRSREGIVNSFKNINQEGRFVRSAETTLILEVLLDIRELLHDIHQWIERPVVQLPPQNR